MAKLVFWWQPPSVKIISFNAMHSCLNTPNTDLETDQKSKDSATLLSYELVQ